MRMESSNSSKQETTVGLVILLALGGILFWVLRTQSRFDPTIIAPVAIKESPAATVESTSLKSQVLHHALGQGMRALTAPESFGPETLSEKIDGKAELYLSAGFQQMLCQRFVRSDDTSSWMEIFVYDMSEMRNAFSVYSSQRRADAQESPFTRFAYHSQNALFFVHGQYYVEIVASSETMLKDMLDYGANFVRSTPAQTGGEVSEMALFPSAGLDQGTISLLSSDVFGFEGLDQVFLATYSLDGVSMTAFVSRRKSEQEAAALASAYETFLVQNDGKVETYASPIPGLRVISIMDGYELVFARGRYLAGVHEADKREPAVGLAVELDKTLQGAAP